MPEVRSDNRTDREQPTRTERDTAEQIARRQPSRDLDLYRDPFSMMNSLHREMERLFDNFGFGPLFSRELGRGNWSPQIELYQRDNKIVVRADLPGLNKN